MIVSDLAVEIGAQPASSRRTVSVVEFGASGDGTSDAGPALQAALDSGASVITVPQGVYKIRQTLLMPSDCTLRLDPSATIIRGAEISAMLLNRTNGLGKYDGASNIEISGGTWDGNAAIYTTACTLIAFGHANKIVVRDTTVRSIPYWHGIELSATRDVLIDQVRFDGCVNEALQLDTPAPQNPGTFPWFGPWDDTKNREIQIRNCLFTNVVNAIGSHSNPAVDDLIISRCYFVRPTGAAIKTVGYAQMTVESCVFIDCGEAIAGDGGLLEVRGNRFEGGPGSTLRTRFRALQFQDNLLYQPVTITSTIGQSVRTSANLAFAEPTSARSFAKLANLALRTEVPLEGDVVAGFVTHGATKRILIRVSGPGLVQFGVAGALADPTFEVIDSRGNVIGRGIRADAEIASLAQQVGAFPFSPTSPDVALALVLEPGSYTVVAGSENRRAGVVLIEVYDASEAPRASVLGIGLEP